MADTLPEHWSYGVCGDGRVFFINDETLRTTWLHPRTGESVNSGHMMRSDLPQGWEEGFTDDGASYFINHNQCVTTFRHPVTGRVATNNLDFILQEQPQGVLTMSLSPPAVTPGRPSSTTVSETSTTLTTSTADTIPASKVSRSSGKVHGFGKRQQSLKRNPNIPVAVRGWLYKQDSTGMRLWKRKWFVLADYCLFYYKDSREESVLGSIPLPSYVISPTGPDDHISRKFAFKAEHSGMRTYLFSADTQEDQSSWLRAMNQAAQMQNQAAPVVRPADQRLTAEHQQAVPQTNHVNHRPAKAPAPETQTGGPLVHEVLLEPIRHGHPDPAGTLLRDPAATVPSEMDTHSSIASNPTAASSSTHFAPVTEAPGSRGPSRAASSTMPPPHSYARNGLSASATPSPILEPNGIGAGTYQRSPSPPCRGSPYSDGPPPREEHRYSGDGNRSEHLEQVEQWIQVQRAEVKGPASRENSLPRRSPSTLPHFSSSGEMRYQTLPKPPRLSPPHAAAAANANARSGEYKYAQDRLSHFRLTPELVRPGTGGGPAYQLYEWQQRHQYRHGSPTAPLYTPAPDYPYGPRPPDGRPRCVAVPPSSPADLPPGFSRTLSPTRRPHTPADRVTVRPAASRSEVDGAFAGRSPRRAKSQMLKVSTFERSTVPGSGYITHTVSAPSLHGKTSDDTYVQLKKGLEYLDLKVVGSQCQKDSGKPVKVAESDVDVQLSRLCEQDKTLKELESRISSLKDDKDQLERVLDMSRQQMEEYQEQPAHAHKVAYQQRLLQEDLVTIRAQISRISTEMSAAWNEYVSLESSVEQLRKALWAQMNHSTTPQQEKTELKRELWRIEDVMAGLSASKVNYKITVDSVQNPERKLAHCLSEGVQIQPPSDASSPSSVSLPHGTTEPWAEDGAPPRPPLPRLYDLEDTPPAVPPLPREAASVVRHTSVRGLKRQSDERRRDREGGPYAANGDPKVELRSYLSEPELPVTAHSVTGSALDNPSFSDKGLFSSGPNQSNSISSYVTLRKKVGGSPAARERPKSALDLMCAQAPPPPSHARSRMTAEEQLERMKRHQRALVRDRQRNLSQGAGPCAGPQTHFPSAATSAQRCSSTSRMPSSVSGDATQDPPASGLPWERYEARPWRPRAAPFIQVFDPREERRPAEGQSDEGRGHVTERGRSRSDGWMTPDCAVYARDADLEPLDYDLDLSRELSKPRKVPIPERYVESDPDEPQSPEELEKRSHRAQRIKALLAKSSVQNMQPALGASTPIDFSELDAVLHQQERIMAVSQALASEASRKSKLVAARAAADD